jgi:hypothetical protein
MDDQLKIIPTIGDHLKNKSLIQMFSKYRALQTVTWLLRILIKKRTLNSNHTYNWLNIIWDIIMNNWLRLTKSWWKTIWTMSLFKIKSQKVKKKRLWRSLICISFTKSLKLFLKVQPGFWNLEMISLWVNIFLICGIKNIKLL